MPARLVPLALGLALLTAAPAAAAEVRARVDPRAGVRYGVETLVAGALRDAGVPVAGALVVLEGRRFPFRRGWRPLASAVTAADGSFEFEIELDRNHRLRVHHADTGDRSRTLRAWVFPSFTLAFAEVRPRVIRITQLYRVPRAVRLTAPTHFYVGSQTARRAPLRATVPTRRVRPGRYRATARVRIPAAYEGRFRYVSCFRYSPRSGMGNPARRCPRRSYPLR